MWDGSIMRIHATWLIVQVVWLLAMPTGPAEARFSSPGGGGWLELASAGGYAMADDHPDFDEWLASPHTVSMWIYMDDVPRGDEMWPLMTKHGAFSLLMRGRPLGVDNVMVHVTYGHVRGGSMCSTALTPEHIPLGAWHHVVWVRADDGVAIFVNGRRISGCGARREIARSEGPLYVSGVATEPFVSFGLRDVGWTPFTQGTLDDLEIAGIARYAMDARTIPVPDAPVQPDEHTVALWRFGFLAGESVADHSFGGAHPLKTFKAHSGPFAVSPRGAAVVLWSRLRTP
jgi:hypothetical protein